MKWVQFHHPDISFPVVRRRIGIEIMEILETTSIFLSKGGWGLLNRSCYPNQAAYLNATSRLRKKGLLVKHSERGETPKLLLSDEGKHALPDYFLPEKMWGKKWNGIWYLLVYDIPEADRKYRDVLRQFLKRMRVGCLQQSVWVTPHDIRPDFDDLSKAAHVDAFAYLFEARTVLGLSKNQVVEDAWNFDRLSDLQDLYCDVMQQNIDRLNAGIHSEPELATLVRIALDAYHGVFAEDPMLPYPLYPKTYQGERVVSLHRTLFSKMGDKL